jgi:hypothetical protein
MGVWGKKVQHRAGELLLTRKGGCTLLPPVKGNYCERFHRSHSDFVERQGLTPEWIRMEKLLVCPSMACSQHRRPFATPEDLVYHFEQLGIAPFWKIGWTPRAPVGGKAAAAAEPMLDALDALEALRLDEAKELPAPAPAPMTLVHVREHFNVVRDDDDALPTCMCCFDADPDIIALPCNHQARGQTEGTNSHALASTTRFSVELKLY